MATCPDLSGLSAAPVASPTVRPSGPEHIGVDPEEAAL